MMNTKYIAATLLAFAPVALWAEADGPDAWRVVGVAADDHLNARMGPSVDYPVLDVLAYNTRDIQVEVCVPTTGNVSFDDLNAEQRKALSNQAVWCYVNGPKGEAGWVNRSYLGED